MRIYFLSLVILQKKKKSKIKIICTSLAKLRPFMQQLYASKWWSKAVLFLAAQDLQKILHRWNGPFVAILKEIVNNKNLSTSEELLNRLVYWDYNLKKLITSKSLKNSLFLRAANKYNPLILSSSWFHFRYCYFRVDANFLRGRDEFNCNIFVTKPLSLSKLYVIYVQSHNSKQFIQRDWFWTKKYCYFYNNETWETKLTKKDKNIRKFKIFCSVQLKWMNASWKLAVLKEECRCHH